MTSLRGKVVVLTGAASGIGLATAHLLASHGALLSLADINTTQLAEVAAELNKQYQSEYLELNPKVVDQIIFSTVDIRSRVACEDWISRTQAHFGQAIAGAANLAGAFGRSIAQEKGSIRNITDEECDFVMDVNCKGLLNCLRAQLPHMRAGTAGRSGGSIVNAASIAGVVGVENNGPYVASKHAVVGITRTVAKEEGPRAIRVNAIAP
jgi:NAD(P)-dependent dehydrogenase (short-subunit alcohol dehydrogenase family)